VARGSKERDERIERETGHGEKPSVAGAAAQDIVHFRDARRADTAPPARGEDRPRAYIDEQQRNPTDGSGKFRATIATPVP
jgi:hypothetical protein